MKAKLVRVEQLNNSVKMFWFKPDSSVRYVAGQFIELSLPHPEPDERGQRRWFTLSSSPSEPLLAITTRITNPGSSSFKARLANLKIGEQVDISAPMGDFILPKDPTIPLVFIAAGMGITPARSIITWLKATGEQRNIKLIYAVHSPNEFLFDEIFSNYPGLNVRKIVGKLDTTALKDQLGSDANSLIYVAGPEDLMVELKDRLLRVGINQERIIIDYFHGYESV